MGRIKVYLLGCGRSILDLSQEKKNEINGSSYSIGINDFCSFSSAVGIYPKIMWFTDIWGPSVDCLKFAEKCFIKDQWYPSKLIVNKRVLAKIKSNSIQGWLASLVPWNLSAWVFHWSKISFHLHVTFKNVFPFSRVYKRSIPFYFSKKVKIEAVERDTENLEETWAECLESPLYSYQTSLASIFNYIYLHFPNSDLFIAGVDLNSPGYFYDLFPGNEVVNVTNHIVEIAKKNGKHVSMINYNGKGVFVDKLDFVKRKLISRDINVFCFNQKSELVLRGFAQFYGD